MYIKNQSFFVFGLSRSGKAAAEYLASRGARVFAYDDVEEGENEREELKRKGVSFVTKEETARMHERCDALVLSPGIPIDHPVAVSFKRNKKAVIGETELAARNMRCPIVAVTGTNGKTTTVSMIEHILNESGKTARSCGNIGTPMLLYADLSEDAIAVAEISSFQLETLSSIRPHISVFLNITEDHLNRHYNMDNYIFLKSKLLKNAAETEFALLNYDDPIVRSFSQKTKAQVVYFSGTEKVDGGYIEGNALYFRGEKIISADLVKTEGKHNLLNALAASCVCKLLGVETKDIAKALATFKGVKHRIEFIGECGGVKYVNDSKGTNVDATVKAVESMKEETVLLLGGKDKGYDYAKLFSFLKDSNVRIAVLYGENRYLLAESALRADFKKFMLVGDFFSAVTTAKQIAKRGETVLLSPASASFDEFSSFEERGERFVAFVRALEEEEKRREKEEEKLRNFEYFDSENDEES